MVASLTLEISLHQRKLSAEVSMQLFVRGDEFRWLGHRRQHEERHREIASHHPTQTRKFTRVTEQTLGVRAVGGQVGATHNERLAAVAALVRAVTTEPAAAVVARHALTRFGVSDVDITRRAARFQTETRKAARIPQAKLTGGGNGGEIRNRLIKMQHIHAIQIDGLTVAASETRTHRRL